MKILQKHATGIQKNIFRGGAEVPTAAQDAVENYKDYEIKTYTGGTMESFLRDTMDYSFDGYSVTQAYKAFRTLHCNIKSGSFYEKTLPDALPSSLPTRSGIKFVQFPESVLKAVISAQGGLKEIEGEVITDQKLDAEAQKVEDRHRGAEECNFIEKKIAPQLVGKQYGEYKLENIYSIIMGEGMYEVYFKMKDASESTVYVHVAGIASGKGIEEGFKTTRIGSYREVLKTITEEGKAYIEKNKAEDTESIEYYEKHR